METASTFGTRRLLATGLMALLLAAALGALAPAAAHAAVYDGLKITTPNGTVEKGTDGQIVLKQDGEYTISGTWMGSLAGVDRNSPKAVVSVPGNVAAKVTLDGAEIKVGSTDFACAFSVGGGGVR